MTRLLQRSLSVIVALACSSQAVSGADPLGEGLRRCARESDQGKRLACFDTLVGTLPKIEADQFGMTAGIAQKRDPGRAYRPEQSEVLNAKIVSLREGSRTEYIFTLDNDQVWVQDEPRPGIRFSVGEAVRIEHGALGSIWLAADKGRKTRIKRVR